MIVPLLDSDRLASLDGLEDEAGSGLIAELIRIFAESTPKTLALLDGYLTAGDLPQATRAAHSLKSSCSALGAIRMLETAAATENAARAGDLSRARSLGAELRACFEPTREALHAYSSGRA